DHAVEARVPGGQLLDSALAELHLRVPGLLREATRLCELLIGVVDSQDAAGCADALGREEDVHPGPAAQVDDALALGESGEAEEVPAPGERLDRAVGDPVEDFAGISEPLRQRAAHLEVVLALGLLGDMAVHVLDLGLELPAVNSCSCRFHQSSLIVSQ